MWGCLPRARDGRSWRHVVGARRLPSGERGRRRKKKLFSQQVLCAAKGCTGPPPTQQWQEQQQQRRSAGQPPVTPGDTARRRDTRSPAGRRKCCTCAPLPARSTTWHMTLLWHSRPALGSRAAGRLGRAVKCLPARTGREREPPGGPRGRIALDRRELVDSGDPDSRSHQAAEIRVPCFTRRTSVNVYVHGLRICIRYSKFFDGDGGPTSAFLVLFQDEFARK